MSYLVFGDDNRMNEVRRLLSAEHSDEAKYVFAPNVKLTAERLFDLPYNAVVYAGGADERAKIFAAQNGIKIISYSDDERFLNENATLTAEATLMILLSKINRKLADNKILVVGFGHCGRAISKLLYELAANFTVMTARPENALIYTSAMSYGGDISSFDVIINTAPSRVIADCQIALLKSGAVIIDISSPPYGLDHERAIAKGIDSAVYPSLPAKFRHVAAAQAIVSNVLGGEYD